MSDMTVKRFFKELLCWHKWTGYLAACGCHYHSRTCTKCNKTTSLSFLGPY